MYPVEQKWGRHSGKVRKPSTLCEIVSKSPVNINASKCNAFTILGQYRCKYSYTSITFILYLDGSI